MTPTTPRERAQAIWPRLRRYQRIGVKFIEQTRRCIIGDEMGTGKTVQTLAWLDIRREERPVTVVCPAGAKGTWECLAPVWTPDDEVVVLAGRRINQIDVGTSTIRIINYDVLKDWLPLLTDSRVVVLDECHRIRNHKTKQTKASQRLCERAGTLIFLSGTPIVNRPSDFFISLNLIDPTTFPSFFKFAFRYCAPRQTMFGWDFRGHSHLDELHKILDGRIMIRRLKADVLDDLPPKTRAVVPLDIEHRAEYTRAEIDYVNWVAKEQRKKERKLTITSPSVSAKTEALKQVALKGKMASVVEWIEEFLESGEKLIVFGTHHWTADHLKAHFGKASVVLDGRVTGNNRQRAIDTFVKNEDVRLLIGHVVAAGVGIDSLQNACSNVAFVELDPVPANHLQAEDRVHRIGQGKPVTAYYLIAKDTIEEHIAGLIDAKARVLQRTLDGKIVSDDGDELVSMLDAIKTRRSKRAQDS